MAQDSWLSGLVEGYPVPGNEFLGYEAEYESLESAWQGESVPLIVWLAARLSPTRNDLEAVLATTSVLVSQRLRNIDEPYLDLRNRLPQLQSIADGIVDDRSAWRLRTEADVVSTAAASVMCLADAARTFARAERAPNGIVRVPSLLAQAVDRASTAFSASTAVDGPLIRMSGGDDLVRSRHELLDGKVRALSSA